MISEDEGDANRVFARGSPPDALHFLRRGLGEITSYKEGSEKTLQPSA